MTARQSVRIAAAQFALDRMDSWSSYEAKIRSWVACAADQGAELLVFPEYAGMELVSIADGRHAVRRSSSRHTLGPLPVKIADRRREQSLDWEAASIQRFLPDYRALFADLAKQHGAYILAGSLPVRQQDGRFRNTAYLAAADGGLSYQEKLVLTRWEAEHWGLQRGEELRVFETPFGRLGIATCYDVEFPLIARRLAEAGARIILAPCCAESLRGYHRVRVGARARALENQAYLILAPLVGHAPWSSTVRTSTGAAGVFAPPDLGARENGVIAEGNLDASEWVYADLDLSAVDRIRLGDLANRDHWAEHAGFGRAINAGYDPLQRRSAFSA